MTYDGAVLLLSYHRCLRMVSEALELSVEGGRVIDNWCMYVVSHDYGGLVQGWRWWMVCMRDKAKGCCPHVGDAGAIPEC